MKGPFLFGGAPMAIWQSSVGNAGKDRYHRRRQSRGYRDKRERGGYVHRASLLVKGLNQANLFFFFSKNF